MSHHESESGSRVDPPPGGFVVDGTPVEFDGGNETLLSVLRDQVGIDAVKDGCSPQGQCGCCTVLVDGKPRVACVTPARRVVGRTITTLDGLDDDRRSAWAGAFCDTGASQCGFCTPGIIVRLDALDRSEQPVVIGEDRSAVEQALLAHLCRCTGWQTVLEAWDRFRAQDPPLSDRDLAAAARRATIEGGAAQRSGPDVALGGGGFAADTAPDGALIALSDGDGGWVLGESMAEATAKAGKVQGRRTTVDHTWPLEVPEGDWDATLRTTWVEPAYLETDASWCEPGGEPFSTVANGGAFGAKLASRVSTAARELADANGRVVLAMASREDSTRWGPKRPPIAGGARADGTGVLRVVRTPGLVEVIKAVAPGLVVEEVDVVGPSTSASIRAAGWAEAMVLLAGAAGVCNPVRSPSGAEAEAEVDVENGVIRVVVRCGPPLDDVVLRSYCIGAAHMAWSWLTSEALTVDDTGEIHDLTIRSFGVLRAVDSPRVEVEIARADGADDEPVNGSDAVFAAVAAAGWLSLGRRQDWPLALPDSVRKQA